jgi:hypothetical protein
MANNNNKNGDDEFDPDQGDSMMLGNSDKKGSISILSKKEGPPALTLCGTSSTTDSADSGDRHYHDTLTMADYDCDADSHNAAEIEGASELESESEVGDIIFAVRDRLVDYNNHSENEKERQEQEHQTRRKRVMVRQVFWRQHNGCCIYVAFLI